MLFWKDIKRSLERNALVSLERSTLVSPKRHAVLSPSPKRNSTLKESDLETGFNLSSLCIRQYTSYAVYALLALLLFASLWFPYFLLLWVFFVIVAVHQWRVIGVLSHPKSIIQLFCLQGKWSLIQRNGQLIENLSLSHYFISPHYLVLHFTADGQVGHEKLVGNKFKSQANSRAKAIKRGKYYKTIHRARYSLMIFPSQAGEKNYRSLFCSLKYQDKRLVNIVAKKHKKGIKKAT